MGIACFGLPSNDTTTGRKFRIPLGYPCYTCAELPHPPGEVAPNVWRRRFCERALKTVGLGHLRPLDLRHAAGALWIAADTRVPKKSQCTRDTRRSAFTLDRYGHLFPGSESALSDSLDALAQHGRDDTQDVLHARSCAIEADSSRAYPRATQDDEESTDETKLGDQGDLGGPYGTAFKPPRDARMCG